MEPEPSANLVKTAKGSTWLMAQSSLNAVLGLFFFMVLARAVAKAEMGVYAGLMFTFGLLQAAGVLGLNWAASRFVPKLLAEGRFKGASAAAKRIVEVGASSAAAAAALHYLLSPYFSLASGGSLEYAGLFRLVSLAVFAGALSFVMNGLLQGLQEFGKLAAIRVAGQVVRVAASVWLLLAGYGLLAAVLGWILFGLILAALPAPFVAARLDLRGSFYPLKPILAFSIPMLGYSLLLFMSNYADLFMVMVYSTPAELGAYNVAITASGALGWVLVASAMATLLPAMSRSYGGAGLKGVERALTKASRYIAFIHAPAALGLTALAWQAIRLMAGAGYDEAVAPLAVVSLLSLAFGLSTPVIAALQAAGQSIKVFKVMAVAVAADAITCLMAVPKLSILGASLGRGALFLATILYGVYEAKKVMEVRFDGVAVLKFTIASALMAAPIALLASRFNSVALLPAYVGLGGALYALAIKGLRALTMEDVRVIASVAPKGLRRLLKPMELLV